AHAAAGLSRAHDLIVRFGWLGTAILSLWLGYLLVWRRGPYLDDYGMKDALGSVLSGTWMIYPLRPITWLVVSALAALLPIDELLVRTATAVCVGCNALLVGWLVYRVLGARLAAVISCWLFLMPFLAWEAVLWVGAAGYVVMVGLVL